MFLVFLLSSFAASEHSRRYKKHLIKQEPKFNENVEDLAEFADYGEKNRKIYKGDTSGSSKRHYMKPRNQHNGEESIPDKYNFDNTHEENGKKVCNPGYISGPIIDRRGCWRCMGECDNVATCEFPGTCVVKVPSINNIQMKNVNSSNFIYVSYTIPDFKLTSNPSTLYCKFDTTKAIMSPQYTKDGAFCPIPIQSSTAVSISFDKESWSDEIEYAFHALASENTPNRSFYWIVFSVILICGLGVGYFFVLRKKKLSSTNNTQHSTKPLAYFPTVDESEKKPYY